MITSTLVAPNALKLLIPQSGQSEDTGQTIPEVELREKGEIFVDGINVSFEQLGVTLIKKLTGQADPAIKLVTTPEVTVRETVKIMNVAAKNNFKVVLKKE
jgi:biopolymer transport protein ExbD